MTWQPPPLPPRQRHRRYPWCRLYNDLPFHPKWRVIANETALPVHEVVVVVTALLCKANGAQPRGSLAEFSPRECAAALELPSEHVAAIYAALEDIGWIDQDYLATWDDRQPDREDRTAAERQRRCRAKGQRPKEVVHMSRRDKRDVTPEEKREVQRHPVDNESVDNFGDNFEARPLAADEWLTEHGIAIIADRLDKSCHKAIETIARWCRDVGPDIVADAIKAADKINYVGAQFHNLVTTQIARARYQEINGPALPLGPVLQRKDSA